MKKPKDCGEPKREKYVIDTIINRLDCYLTTSSLVCRIVDRPFNISNKVFAHAYSVELDRK